MKKTNLIIPAAGQSTRFPDVKPKWMLTHPSGKLMAVASISGLNLKNVENVYFTVLKKHLIDERISEKDIFNAFEQNGIDRKRLNILVLDEPTENQPQTIAETIEHFEIDGPIYIKDPDNYFIDTPTPQNSVTAYELQKDDNINGANKSYVTVDEFGFVNNIVEKKIISSTFCTGGQSFSSSKDFLKFYKKSDRKDSGFYVSHIIFNMILNKIKFLMVDVKQYYDWGTLKDWNGYKRKYATIFVDLDGVLVNNGSQYFAPYWGETEGISQNITAINELYNSGKIKIIITTARDRSCAKITEKQLKSLNILYHDIIFDLPHSKRIIINDFAKTNPYKSCDAINLERNSDKLGDMLSGMFEET
jgi:hypothetical protein